MARILIVEDEREMAQGLKDNFEFEGDEVTMTFDGIEGYSQAKSVQHDIIILDVMLPKMSGFEVCKKLRAEGNKTPILMLTARGQEIDRVLGLELGADDYLIKPFSVRELLARVRAILRRCPPEEEENTGSVQMGKLCLDFDKYRASDGDADVHLTHKEFETLRYFYAHKGNAVSRDELLDKVWGYESFPTTRTVDNYIARIRKRVEHDPNNPRHIITVHGTGYKYVE